MTKNKYKLIKDLINLTILTEILSFIGITLYALGKDLNLEKTSELGLITYLFALIFSTFSLIAICIKYKKESKKRSRL